jgi:hypothetical protein
MIDLYSGEDDGGLPPLSDHQKGEDLPKAHTVTGYIVGLFNPHYSGLATVQVASRKDARRTGRPGKLTTLYVEAGFGVRQIVAYFDSWDALVAQGPTTKLTFALEAGFPSLIAGIVE